MGVALITGTSDGVAPVALALADRGFETYCAALGSRPPATLFAEIPSGSVDYYVQLPTTGGGDAGEPSPGELRTLVETAVLTRFDTLAAMSRLLTPDASVMIVAGDRAGAVLDIHLGLTRVYVHLAQVIFAAHGLPDVRITIVSHDLSASGIAALASNPYPFLRSVSLDQGPSPAA